MLERVSSDGDCITFDFDVALLAWIGEREAAGKVSLYRGPLLPAWDRRFNQADPMPCPRLISAIWPGRRLLGWPLARHRVAAPGCEGRRWWQPAPMLLRHSRRGRDTVYDVAATGGVVCRLWVTVAVGERGREDQRRISSNY
jgi:hypothetical protein